MFSPIGCSFSAATVLVFARSPACIRSGSLSLRIYVRGLPSLVLLPPPPLVWLVFVLPCLRFFARLLPLCLVLVGLVRDVA